MSDGYLLSCLECRMLCEQGLWSQPCVIALSWNSLIFEMSSCCLDYSTWEERHLCCVIKVCSMIVISSGTPTPYIHTSSNQKVSSLTSRVTRFVDPHDWSSEFHNTFSITVWLVIGDRLLKPCYLGRGDHNWKIRTRKQKTDVGKYSFINRTIRNLNQLPASPLASFPCKLNTFRKNVKNVVTSKGIQGGVSVNTWSDMKCNVEEWTVVT